MSFLGLKDKTFLVVGVANRKSVAWSVAKLLQEEGAKILYCVRSEKGRPSCSLYCPVMRRSSLVILKKNQKL